ncbi:MAG: TIGR00645 family protein [Alphaproteobacteria bacterium]|nr:TIGR00645 family protein [Alphaproteobacteria bacterium]
MSKSVPPASPAPPRPPLERLIENTIFASRWLMVPLLLGLVLALGLYIYKFFQELLHLYATIGSLDEGGLMLGMLSLVDIVMVASLVTMVIISGYENFVSRLDVDAEHHGISWLGKLDAGSLKIKLAASIVAISSIHLLQAFLNVEHIANDKLLWLVVIHMTFVISALMMALLDKLAFAGHRD